MRPAALRSLLLSRNSNFSWFQTSCCSFETPLSPFPCSAKFSFSQYRLSCCKSVAPKLWSARSQRHDLRIPGALQSGALPSSGRAPQPVASCARRGGEAVACRCAAAGEPARPGALLSDTIPDSAQHCHLTPPHDARHICRHVTALAPEQPSK